MDPLLVLDHILTYLPLTDQPILNKQHALVIKNRLYSEYTKAAESAQLLGINVPIRIPPKYYSGVPNCVIIQTIVVILDAIAQHFLDGNWGRLRGFTYGHFFVEIFERIDLVTFRTDDPFYRAVIGDVICDQVKTDSNVFYEVVGAVFPANSLGLIINNRLDATNDVFS